MKAINYSAKAEHFAELASRAAIRAAYSDCPGDREQWEERAARYDAQAASYLNAARKAA